MGRKIIKFSVNNDEFDIIKLPSSAKNYIPQWYKDIPLLEDKKTYDSITLKGCVPFLDTLTSGYIFELWCDIEVIKNENNEKTFNWKYEHKDFIKIRESNILKKDVPSKNGFYPPIFTIESPLFIKTPPGYSVLITTPFNRFDLPIQILSGIIDTDKNPLHNGDIPFILNANFEGVIKSGTPLLQIIPFKRDSWDSVKDTRIIKEGLRSKNKMNTLFYGGYKKLSWTKKDFR